ncbi:MAG: hypothetical protein ACRD96_19815 [Bryobacteraceae bacterium]
MDEERRKEDTAGAVENPEGTSYRKDLEEERRRREELERRIDELVAENQKSRAAAAETERQAEIRAELQKLGVTKVDLAFRVVRDDVVRREDGRLVAKGEHGEVGLREYLAGFLSANPEFLPARIVGGSGVTSAAKGKMRGGVELEQIRPGMSREEMERAREEILRVASQTLRGI